MMGRDSSGGGQAHFNGIPEDGQWAIACLYIVMMRGYGANYFGDGFSSLIQLNDNIARGVNFPLMRKLIYYQRAIANHHEKNLRDN